MLVDNERSVLVRFTFRRTKTNNHLAHNVSPADTQRALGADNAPESRKCKIQNKQQKNMYTNREKIEWTLIFVYEFGRRYGLTTKQAFNYLKRYKGIDFVDRHYDYVHTQSFESMINDISEYCRLKGGMLQ